jgi:hypothetical protein
MSERFCACEHYESAHVLEGGGCGPCKFDLRGKSSKCQGFVALGDSRKSEHTNDVRTVKLQEFPRPRLGRVPNDLERYGMKPVSELPPKRGRMSKIDTATQWCREHPGEWLLYAEGIAGLGKNKQDLDKRGLEAAYRGRLPSGKYINGKPRYTMNVYVRHVPEKEN